MRLPRELSTIRSWEWRDVESLVRHANNINIWRTLRDEFPNPYSESDAKRWIQRCSESEPETHFAIEIGGYAVGAIGFKLGSDVYYRSAEIGYWLGEKYWGRGIMTEAVRALTDYAFGSFDICRIFARVFDQNQASMNVLAKAGYQFEARLKSSVTKEHRTLDELIFAMVKE